MLFPTVTFALFLVIVLPIAWHMAPRPGQPASKAVGWKLAAAGDQWRRATTETLRTKLMSMPARLVHTARRLKLRAPTNWPWRDAFETALVRIAAIPAPT